LWIFPPAAKKESFHKMVKLLQYIFVHGLKLRLRTYFQHLPLILIASHGEKEIPTSSRKKYVMHHIFLQDRKKDIDDLEGVFKS
jgi:hypothetical protein